MTNADCAYLFHYPDTRYPKPMRVHDAVAYLNGRSLLALWPCDQATNRVVLYDETPDPLGSFYAGAHDRGGTIQPLVSAMTSAARKNPHVWLRLFFHDVRTQIPRPPTTRTVASLPEPDPTVWVARMIPEEYDGASEAATSSSS